VAKSGGHLPTEKGKPKGGAPRGKQNHRGGPRIGRERGGNKSDKPRGKPFEPGTNSHTGEIFRRGPNELPIAPTLMLKIKAYDRREKISERIDDILDNGTRREFLALYELMGVRIDGLPIKKVAVAKFAAGPTLVFTDHEGKETPDPALPAPTPTAEPLVLAGQAISGPLQVR
jgi:hypothetical protein